MSAHTTFRAKLAALGSADGMDLADFGSRPLLIFTVSVEEARKCAALFGKETTLTTAPSADPDLLAALEELYEDALSFFGGPQDQNEEEAALLEKCRAAIAKARGGK